MPYDIRRSGRIPRGDNAVRFVSFGAHADVIVNGDVAAIRRALINKSHVLVA